MSRKTPLLAPSESPRAEPPTDLQSLFGPAPLLAGEDARAYEALKGQIRAAVAPTDVIEEIWVRDVLDLLWETMRLRRLKAKLMQAAAHEGLDELLRPLTEILEHQDLSNGWARRDARSVKKVDALLQQAGLDPEAIAAQTLAVKLDAFERIDRMIMQAEARRNMILREIDRHRDVLARRARGVGPDRGRRIRGDRRVGAGGRRRMRPSAQRPRQSPQCAPQHRSQNAGGKGPRRFERAPSRPRRPRDGRSGSRREIEGLARAIAGPDADPLRLERARRIAEAQIDCCACVAPVTPCWPIRAGR